MAAAVPQPQAPPMAHLSRDGSDRASAIASAILLKQQNAASNGPSPFSTTSSPRTDSPTSPSLDSHRALGMTVSEKSSFSSTSSAPASPASLSYSPAVQSALRDSCRSSISSHNSSQAFPQSSHHKSQKDIEKQQSPKRSNNEIPSDRSTTAHYHASSYGAPEPEYEQEDTNAENKAISILVRMTEHLKCHSLLTIPTSSLSRVQIAWCPWSYSFTPSSHSSQQSSYSHSDCAQAAHPSDNR